MQLDKCASSGGRGETNGPLVLFSFVVVGVPFLDTEVPELLHAIIIIILLYTLLGARRKYNGLPAVHYNYNNNYYYI